MSTNEILRIGSFAIESELSSDELGSWYRARDERLDRAVALRVWRLPGSRAELRPAIRERARITAGLDHPNLPTVFGREELGELDLLSMEFIDGESLADVLRSGRAWRPLDAARLVIPIADAVAVAHTAGLTHGTIGPERIRLDAEGRPMLLGLGVARTEAEALTPVGEGKRRDVQLLARLVGLLTIGPAIRGRTADPMLAVEQNLLEPVLMEAARERSKRLPDAAALRDALLAVVSPAQAPHRRSPPPPPPGDTPAGAAGPRAPAHGATVAPAAGPGQAEPRSQPRRPPAEPPGHISVLLPVDRHTPGERRRGRRVVTGLLLGALLGVGGVAAWRSGMLPLERLPGRDAALALIRPDEAANEPALPVPPPRESAATPEFAEGTVPAPPAGSDTSLVVAGVPEVETRAATPPPAVETPPPPPPPPPPAEQAAPPVQRQAATRTARISVTPGDAIISRVSDGEALGMGTAELSVAPGQSVPVQIHRRGYVAEERLFTGEPLSIALRPDSVTVHFLANVPVEVAVETGEGVLVLGSTNLEARLPTGEYRVFYRAPGYDEWSVVADFARAGSSYSVSKMDYATRGSVVIAVENGWAEVSINGSAPRETPARFDNLPDAPHIVRLSRAGYRTIVDTIRIAPGRTTHRQYRLEPIR